MATPPKLMDRKTFLTSTLAWAAVTLSGCSNGAMGGGTGGGTAGNGGGTGGGNGGGGKGGAAGAQSGSGGSEAKGGSGGNSGGGNGSASGGTSGSGGTAGGGGSAMGGTNAGGMGGGGSSGTAGAGGDMSMGGEGGGTEDAGDMVDAGPLFKCVSQVSFVNNHTHELVLPPADVEAGLEQTYMLAAGPGAAAHTHMLTVTGYDFIYLKAGVVAALKSKENATGTKHVHDCSLLCTKRLML